MGRGSQDRLLERDGSLNRKGHLFQWGRDVEEEGSLGGGEVCRQGALGSVEVPSLTGHVSRHS